MTIRSTYLETATTAVNLITAPVVGARWDEASACEGLTVGALAAHLARSLIQVETGLSHPVPTGALITAVEYYAVIQEQLLEPDSDLNAGVVERAREAASVGFEALASEIRLVLERLRHALAEEPDTRTVVAFGAPMLLDEYLRTRVIELVVHLDDLTTTLDQESLAISPDAYRAAIETLFGIACERSGNLAVLRALTRRDRTVGDPLRVL